MVTVKDELLRVQLSKIVEAGSALSDPFAADLMYHFSCWRDYISNPHFDPKEVMYLQNVTYSEMKQMFFKKVIKLFLQNTKSSHFTHFCMNMDKLQ